MTLTQQDEQRWSDWMRRSQAGHDSCYAQLLTELGDVINTYLRSRFGPIDLIEDCVQESLIAIHSARHTYDSKRQFRPWLFAIVQNRTIDLLRKQRKHTTNIESHALNGHNQSANAVEDEVSKSMIFDALAPAYRDVLLLTKVIGLSTAETAEQLGISEGAVRVRVHRGIEATRKLLQSEQTA